MASTNLSEFHPIDLLFAERMCPKHREAHFFLASLLKSAREGHMFLEKGDTQLPEHLFDHHLVENKGRIYLRRNWECESRFIYHLKRLRNQKPAIAISQRPLEGLPLNEQQQKAILKCAANTLTLISGGPGTGKTYTATTMIRLFMEQGLRNIVVAAPTGKATANIRNALNDLAEKCTFKTLHALIRHEKIHADLVVVDEGSMVDAERMQALFAAIKDGARLVLLGDKDQLPPIESGNFFADLAQNSDLVAELTTCLRCELKDILDLASQVKQGELISTIPLPNIKSLVNLMMEKKMHVLTPLKKGLYGTDHLNQVLYKEHAKRGAKHIPIMITVNDPHLNLFNGDTGTLDRDENLAYFADNRPIPEYSLPHYVYAYVISIHKSQGSEYDNTMILLPKGSEVFGREMLYTAITRTKKQLMILAEEGVVEQLVKTHYRRRSTIINSFFDDVASSCDQIKDRTYDFENRVSRADAEVKRQ